MRTAYLGLALGVILSCFGTTQSYADDFTASVDAKLKAGTITQDEARKMLRGHIEEQISSTGDINDLISKAEGLSTPSTGFRKKCDKGDKGCSIM